MSLLATRAPGQRVSYAQAAVLAAAAAAAATAVWVEVRSRQADRDHPPTGKFIHIDGVRIHYEMQGEGPPVVLLHGNTVTLADFRASGLIDQLARNHRVIAFDRPGFGHSARPRDRLWTPDTQAALLRRALAALGVDRPCVVGHSLGTQVALAMALDHPSHVAGLVLVGGYFYPTPRLDVALTASVALPGLGDLMRYTVTALSGRALLGRLVKTLFAPREVAPAFSDMVPRELMLRPSQLRAAAEDAAFMIPTAQRLASRYGELRVPVTLIAGAADQVVDPEAHSRRLHRELPNSQLIMLPRSGHMAHYVARDAIAALVDAVATAPPGASGAPRTQAAAGSPARDGAESEGPAQV